MPKLERRIVVFRKGRTREGIARIRVETGASASDVIRTGNRRRFPGGYVPPTIRPPVLVLSSLDLAVVRTNAAGAANLSAALGNHSPFLAVTEPAKVQAQTEDDPPGPLTDGPLVTWGLQALGITGTPAPMGETAQPTGAGVRLAVLDSGLDLSHPDFPAARIAQAVSFVLDAGGAEMPVSFGPAHGTHCTGVAAGPATPSSPPRYGVAPDTQLYIGRVLDDAEFGDDEDVLRALDWAILNDCQVILFASGRIGPVSADYEAAGIHALDANCLVVAAAGNNGRAAGTAGQVMCPANGRGVMAVGAIDEAGAMLDTSAHAMTTPGGRINVVAPGANILTSARVLEGEDGTLLLYGRAAGTSLAAAFVAGMAALYVEARGLRGRDLRRALGENAVLGTLTTPDAGKGVPTMPVTI